MLLSEIITLDISNKENILFSYEIIEPKINKFEKECKVHYLNNMVFIVKIKINYKEDGVNKFFDYIGEVNKDEYHELGGLAKINGRLTSNILINNGAIIEDVILYMNYKEKSAEIILEKNDEKIKINFNRINLIT